MGGRRALERILRERTASVGEQPVDAEPSVAEAREDASGAHAPLDVSNAIERLLKAFEDKDYFRMLELPAPDVDELGRPAWSATSTDVSKAYRRLSVMVHPDKNPGTQARAAFEALNAAKRILGDPGQLEELLKKHCDDARRRRELAEATATPEERVTLFAAKNEKMRQLRKQEGASWQAEMEGQLREKQERAKRKRMAQSRYRKNESDGEEELTRDDPELCDEQSTLFSKQKRSKPKLIF